MAMVITRITFREWRHISGGQRRNFVSTKFIIDHLAKPGQRPTTGDAMTPRSMKTIGTPGPGKGPVMFQAMTACDCGCGRKARFEFVVGRDKIEIDDPEAIAAMIAEMQAGYRMLWGKRPKSRR